MKQESKTSKLMRAAAERAKAWGAESAKEAQALKARVAATPESASECASRMVREAAATSECWGPPILIRRNGRPDGIYRKFVNPAAETAFSADGAPPAGVDFGGHVTGKGARGNLAPSGK